MANNASLCGRASTASRWASVRRVHVMMVLTFMLLLLLCPQEKYQHALAAIEQLAQACVELSGSESLVRVFGCVLALGNRMNAGTPRGNAKAFDIDTLSVLSSMRSTDGSTSFIEYVADVALTDSDSESEDAVAEAGAPRSRLSSLPKQQQQGEEDALYSVELRSLSAAAKGMSFTEMDEIAHELAAAIEGANQLQQQRNADVELRERVLQPFVRTSNESLQHLRERLARARHLYEEMAAFYLAHAYDVSRAIELLKLIDTFCGELSRASQSRRRSAKAQRQRKRQQQRPRH